MKNSDKSASLNRVRQTFYNQSLFAVAPEESNPSRAKVVGNNIKKFWLNVSMLAAILVLMFYFLPNLVFGHIPGLNQTKVLGEAVREADTAYLDDQVLWQPGEIQGQTLRKIRPKYDLTAPEGKWVRSDRAEINAEMFTNDDIDNKREVNALLSKGLYLYPEYAGIGEIGKTVIIAGHHYNMHMSALESKKSFQNLDKVQVGDRIEIVDDYKIWTYEVYKVEQAKEVTEETADLILYTCVFWWDSELRLFVYGNLVEE